MYVIDRSNARGPEMRQRLYGLDLVSEPVRDAIVAAWSTMLAASPYRYLADVPFGFIEYSMEDHINEVTRTGLDLANRAANDWGVAIDHDVLVPILVLHDVDKPLMFARENGKIEATKLWREIPHGVVGAMLLRDLGFPHVVVSTVAVHSQASPFHGENFEAFLLHYADSFSADHAIMKAGKGVMKPFYQQKK
jgi:putative nucleotidyltransferase with HDIG domain